MALALHTILGDGVILPHDLVPDDAPEVVHDNYDKIMKRFEQHSNVALAYYNKKHDTDYKVVTVNGGGWCFHTEYSFTYDIIHHGFSAAETTDARSAQFTYKNFFAVINQQDEFDKPEDELVVSSCQIADGLKTVGCKTCDVKMCKPFGERLTGKVVDLQESGLRCLSNDNVCGKKKSIESIFSQYAHCLASDVKLSEKAQWRVEYSVLALVHFNQKKHKDYKLVEALPYYLSNGIERVIHCNFIARQNSPADDVSKKLFFAELKRNFQVKGAISWTITACHIVHGCETRAGCILCVDREGKKVVHPSRGFRFGMYPRKYLPRRQRLPFNNVTSTVY